MNIPPKGVFSLGPDDLSGLSWKMGRRFEVYAYGKITRVDHWINLLKEEQRDSVFLLWYAPSEKNWLGDLTKCGNLLNTLGAWEGKTPQDDPSPATNCSNPAKIEKSKKKLFYIPLVKIWADPKTGKHFFPSIRSAVILAPIPELTEAQIGVEDVSLRREIRQSVVDSQIKQVIELMDVFVKNTLIIDTSNMENVFSKGELMPPSVF